MKLAMHRSALILATMCALVATPRTSRAQQVAYAANTGPELDSATQAVVAREIANARARGLPVDALFAKVREGRLKRAAGPRIQSAVIKLAERLGAAREALGAQSSADELQAGADALSTGADATALRTLRAATPRPIAVPLATLAQLVASGVPSSKAAEMVVGLLRRNATPVQLLALGNLVESDVASGLRPEESALFRLRAIEGGLLRSSDAATVASPGLAAPTVSTPKAPPAGTRRP